MKTHLKQALRASTAALVATSLLPATTFAQSVDVTQWSPEYVRSIAGTATYNAAEHCSTIVPLDYTGRVSFWYVGAFEADPLIHHEMDRAFWDAFKQTYPNIKTEVQSVTYNEMFDKYRTALLGNAAPMVIRLMLLGTPEFASKGYLQPLAPEDVGYDSADFWPGAMKSVTWKGETYGIPTNNETMALIWNAKIFADAGLDPEKAPATWDDVVAYSKQIHDKLGISGYGLVAKQNAGNTPYRFMPTIWAYGGGAFDEAEASPDYSEVYLDNEGTKAALQAAYQMYVVDQSVPVSALTNTQSENQAPFISGQLAMMIAHPAEYARMNDLASKATGTDRAIADEVIANMRYGLIPEGPARRAVVFGGSNIHKVKPEFVEGEYDEQAAQALVCMFTSPEWSIKMSWAVSNPGHLGGFRTEWMKERLDTIKFLDISTSMLSSGVPFPVVPESTEIMNIIVPDMMQNVLTQNMTVDEAAKDAADKVRELVNGL